jgi:formate dehydrogenase subunit gamma
VGEIVRYKRDVWGEEVILGVSWDLLWVVAVAVLVLLATHAIIMAALANKKMDKKDEEFFVTRLLTGYFIG